jgi:ABC-type transporter Mla subunit MlaD
MRRSELALVSIGQVFTGVRNRIAVALAPTLEAAANAFVALASSTSPLSRAFDAVLANLDRLMIYAGTFASFLAGRWVAAMAAAALSVRGLATTLVVLKGALIRTGIGALIVGAGELVYWFTKLAEKTGGIGVALTLLRDVASEVWDRVAMSARAAWAGVEANWATLQAGIYGGLQGALDAVVGWADKTIGAFKGTFAAVQVIWAKLPSALGELMIQSANSVIGGVESLINGVIDRINGFIGTVNEVLAKLPDWAQGDWSKIDLVSNLALPDIANPLAGAATDAGAAAAEAFQRAFEQSTISAPPVFDGMTEDARARAAAYAEAAGMLSKAADRPMTAWAALKEAVTGAGNDGAAALGGASDAANRLGASLDGAGRSGSGAKDKILTGFAAVTKSLSDYAKDALNWGKGLGETLTGAFSGAENAFRSFVETGKLDFKGLVRSILADLAVLAFKRAVLGPIASALSGIFGGGSVTAAVAHTGGIVGMTGQSRAVPAVAFATAPRMHSGGWAGLRPDEVPTILQRGERVLSRAEVARAGDTSAAPSVHVTIDARGAQMGVAEQIDTRLRAALPEIARIAKQSVADGRRRGQVI